MKWWTWLVGVLGFAVGAALGGKSASLDGSRERRRADDAPNAPAPPAPDHHLPSPSVWPAVLAAGLALVAFGVPTSYAFTAVGALVVAWALTGWIGELRRGI